MIIPLSSKIPGPGWPYVEKVVQKRERVLPKEGGYFVHVTSRVRGQDFLLGTKEKEAFRELAFRWAEFSGISVVTYCVMSNHFHLLLWVPEKEEVGHDEVVRRLKLVWSKDKVKEWEAFYGLHPEEDQKKLDAQVIDRMCDLAEFMRVLKHGYTLWYNRTHDSKGAFWDARYRSVVVEGRPLALMSVAAYIDLNPIRAGMVEDPMEYRWSGYAAAYGGGKAERNGLELLARLARGHLPQKAEGVRLKQLREAQKKEGGKPGTGDWRAIGPQLEAERKQRAAPKDWGEVQAAYRLWLYAKGESKADVDRIRKKMRDRKGFDEVEVMAEMERMGEVPMARMLRQRVKTFSRGVAIGGDAFLGRLMTEHRESFGKDRKAAGRKLPGKGWLGIEALRVTSDSSDE
ncbi:MAG: transposase [Kiritimatiellae bacterium]|nr:transposase [Kiritimatiellia bacterium]